MISRIYILKYARTARIRLRTIFALTRMWNQWVVRRSEDSQRGALTVLVAQSGTRRDAGPEMAPRTDRKRSPAQ